MRDELEHLLDDDDDMAEMYLTEKMVQQQLENSSTSSIPERDETDDEVQQLGKDDRYDLPSATLNTDGHLFYFCCFH